MIANYVATITVLLLSFLWSLPANAQKSVIEI